MLSVQKWIASAISFSLFLTSFSLTEVAHASKIASQTPNFISQLHIPEVLGTVTDAYNSTSLKHVVLIQDFHLHYATQQRIVKILERLSPSVVAVEGTQGIYDTTPLASVPAGPGKTKLIDCIPDNRQ